MSVRAITGLRIRERRRALGLKQNELASRAGISPSYLNLIERNRRAIGGALLARIGRELSLSIGALDGSAERRLRDRLAGLAEDPVLGAAGMRAESPDELIARHPEWARGAVRAYEAWRAAEAEAEALADRLAHDPVLAEAMHALLTEITALRSTAEILADPRGLAPEQRSRFERIVFEQSGRLARSAGALAARFDETAEARRPRFAVEEAEEFLRRGAVGEAVEAAAERLAEALIGDGRDAEAALGASLRRPPPLAPDWSRARRLDTLAEAVAAEAGAPEIEAALEACAPDARPHARAALRRRLADALLLPAPRLLELGARLGWGIEAMVRAMGGEGALVFRRVAALGASGAPEAGLVTADASGAVLARAGAPELLPRTRRLDCPIWPVHRAGAGRWLHAEIETVAGERRRAAALGRADGMATDMLLFASGRPAAPVDDAGAVARAAHAARSGPPPLAVGPGCRICPRPACPVRREPSALQT